MGKKENNFEKAFIHERPLPTGKANEPMYKLELTRSELEALKWHLGILIETHKKHDTTLKALYNKLFGNNNAVSFYVGQ